jgi:hypothetical protein
MGTYDILKAGGVGDDLVNVVAYPLRNTQISSGKVKKNLTEYFHRKVEEENHDVVDWFNKEAPNRGVHHN